MKVNISGGNFGKVYMGEVITIYEGQLQEEVEAILQYKPSKRETVRVFFSYAHEDEDIKDGLEKHLQVLQRAGSVDLWTDRMISPGEEWDVSIKQALMAADIVLLLISADFIASSYIWEVELATALQRHASGLAVVIPVFCRACEFSDMPFSKLQGLPKHARPIASAEKLEEALLEVVAGIKLVVEKLTDAK
jgi:internalin A